MKRTYKVLVILSIIILTFGLGYFVKVESGQSTITTDFDIPENPDSDMEEIDIDDIESFDSSNGLIKVFFHIYCNINTSKIIQDQITKIIFSPLYQNVDIIYCFLTGEEKFIEECRLLLNKCGKKFHIQDIGINDKSYERFTLYRIKHLINPSDKILYIHSKGTTKPDDLNVYLWRTYMEYFLFKKSSYCIKLLDTYDVVGVDYHEGNIILNHFDSPFYVTPHFSGNFWWTTGKYFLTLPDYIGSEYLDPEMYLFKKNPKYFELNNSKNVGRLYNEPFHIDQYIDQYIDKKN